MKKRFFKASVSCLICVVFFVGVSYAYLSSETEKAKTDVEKVKNDEPYANNTPTNCGLLLSMPDNTGLLFYLDFLKTGITVITVDNINDIENEYRGYSVDYHIYADYSLVSGIIDRIGGIEIEENGETLRLTGVQVVEKLGTDTERLAKYRILKSVFKSISENGLSRSDFIYIIENCDSTELSLPDCFYWSNYIKDMGANISIVA